MNTEDPIPTNSDTVPTAQSLFHKTVEELVERYNHCYARLEEDDPTLSLSAEGRARILTEMDVIDKDLARRKVGRLSTHPPLGTVGEKAALTFMTTQAIRHCAEVSGALVDVITHGPMYDGDGGPETPWDCLGGALDRLIACIDAMEDQAARMAIVALQQSTERQRTYQEVLRIRYQQSANKGLLKLPVYKAGE